MPVSSEYNQATKHPLHRAYGSGLLLLLLVLSHPLAAQKQVKSRKDAVLTFANGRVVTKEEFEHAYLKQFGSTAEARDHNPKQYREYLKRYADFVRKVMEGEELGLDTSMVFRREYEDYLAQLRQSFLAEGKVLGDLVDEAYERSQIEIRASHILITLSVNASPADTLKAYTLALAIRDSISDGKAKFADLAARHSADASTVANGGDLGYFSVLEMVYPFETAAYQTGTGQVSLPVRSQYGYHILLVQDKLISRGTKRVAHVMVQAPQVDGFATNLDTTAAKQRIFQYYQRLNIGGSFEELARCCSDDQNTTEVGGDLGSGRLISEMEAYKHRLQLGQYSEPFLTRYGWHILKVTEEQPIPNPAEAKAELKQRIRQDQRYDLAQRKFLEALKEEYHFRVNRSVAREVLEYLGDRYLVLRNTDAFNLPEDLLSTTICSFGDVDLTVLNLLQYRLQEGNQMGTPEASLETDIQRLTDRYILDYEESQLAIRYPEFRALSREYHDGILLFSLMEEKVWRRASEDTAGLRRCYEQNKLDFVRPPALRVLRMQASDLNVLASLQRDLVQEKSNQNQFASLDPKQVQNGQMSYQVNTYLLSDNDTEKLNEFLKHQPGYCTPVMQQPDGSFVQECYTEKVHPGGPVSFPDCRADVVRLYQQQLENKWLRQLARKYPVTIHEKNLSRLFRK